jgi:chromosome segregation ATPase
LESEHAGAMERLTQTHAAECEQLRSQVAALEAAVVDLKQQLSSERRAREALEEERARLNAQLDSTAKNADASRGELEDRLRQLSASEAALNQELSALKRSLGEVRRQLNPEGGPSCMPMRAWLLTCMAVRPFARGVY